MMSYISFPLFLASGISLLLGSFYSFLLIRIKSRHKKNIETYASYTVIAIIYSIFFCFFGLTMNTAHDLPLMSLYNRLAVIAASFTAPATLMFFKTFFHIKTKWDVWTIMVISAFFCIPAFFEWDFFLTTSFYEGTAVYQGLQFGPLFLVWGLYINSILFYILLVLIYIIIQNVKNREIKLRNHGILFLASGFLWVTFGILDTLTAIRILDTIPLSWIGALMMLIATAGALISEIEDLYSNVSRLYNEVIHDKLTGTFSRNYLEIRLGDLFENYRRHEGSFYLGVMDLDEFKAINDNFGHLVGDMVLKTITETLKYNLRPTDIVARMGGDEFVFILEQVQDDALKTILGRIKSRISQLEFFPSPQTALKVTCSFGLAVATHQDLLQNLTPEALIDRADRALYESKRSGRNLVALFDEKQIQLLV